MYPCTNTGAVCHRILLYNERIVVVQSTTPTMIIIIMILLYDQTGTTLPTEDYCKHINIIIKTAAGVARVFCRVYVDDNGSRGYQSYYLRDNSTAPLC